MASEKVTTGSWRALVWLSHYLLVFTSVATSCGHVITIYNLPSWLPTTSTEEARFATVKMVINSGPITWCLVWQLHHLVTDVQVPTEDYLDNFFYFHNIVSYIIVSIINALNLQYMTKAKYYCITWATIVNIHILRKYYIADRIWFLIHPSPICFQ